MAMVVSSFYLDKQHFWQIELWGFVERKEKETEKGDRRRS